MEKCRLADSGSWESTCLDLYQIRIKKAFVSTDEFKGHSPAVLETIMEEFVPLALHAEHSPKDIHWWANSSHDEYQATHLQKGTKEQSAKRTSTGMEKCSGPVLDLIDSRDSRNREQYIMDGLFNSIGGDFRNFMHHWFLHHSKALENRKKTAPKSIGTHNIAKYDKLGFIILQNRIRSLW